MFQVHLYLGVGYHADTDFTVQKLLPNTRIFWCGNNNYCLNICVNKSSVWLVKKELHNI